MNTPQHSNEARDQMRANLARVSNDVNAFRVRLRHDLLHGENATLVDDITSAASELLTIATAVGAGQRLAAAIERSELAMG